MTNNPLVTVAIPSYNHGKYISHTIQSILNQTFQNFEILIVDDCSTDNTLDVIKQFNDPRIRVITSQQNEGMCITGNTCLKNALGKYTAIIGSDDTMTPEKLEKQVKFLEENNTFSAVFSGTEIIDEHGKTNLKKTEKYTKIFEKENRTRHQWLNYFFHHGNCLSAPSMLATTESLKKAGGFDPRFIQAHDFDLWVRLCLTGHDIHIIHEKLLKYREISSNSNLSCNTEEVRIRLLFDNEKTLENFLTLSSLDSLKHIFPDHDFSSYQNIPPEKEPLIIKFILFKEACKNISSQYHMQFASNLIFSLLRKGEDQDFLREQFNFDLKEYKKIISQNPLGLMIEKYNKLCVRKILKMFKKMTSH